VNDYNFMWMAGKAKHEVESYMPRVVKKITMGVEVHHHSVECDLLRSSKKYLEVLVLTVLNRL
jgi:hypothetical protein